MSYVASGYPKFTYSQLEELWIQAGGPKAVAGLMAAIALAESGGIAGNTNPTDNNGTQTSWGLWQVSDGTHGWSYGGDPHDPLTNAKAAVMKYHSQGLGAWGTYSSGAYQQYLKGNVPPGTGPIPQGSGSGGSAGFRGANAVPVTTLASFSSFPISPIANPVGSIIGDIAGIGGSGSDNPFDWVLGPIKSGKDAFAAIGNSLKDIAMVFNGVLWLFNPANDVRVISGFVGIIVLGLALYLVATA